MNRVADRAVLSPGDAAALRAAASPRRSVAAVVLAVVLLLVGGIALTGCSASPAAPARVHATGPSSNAPHTQQNAPGPSVAREDALAALLRTRAAAVLTRNRAAFAATLDSTRSGFGLRQLEAFDALSRLPLGSFSYGTPEPAPALSAARVAQLGPDAWVARVTGHYGLAGFDTAQRDFESYFSVVRRGGRWKLADDTDGGTQPQLWDLPQFTVLRNPTTLVIGVGPVARLRPYLALGNAAVSAVRQVWQGQWNGHLVLVVPGSAAQMAEQVGQQAGQVDQVAAITDGPFDAQGRAGADRVVVNPAAFARLQRRGQQVVISHEATHVAIRATTDRPVPLWLSEGMADFVGYRGSGATRQEVAAPLLDRVRAGKGPQGLPTAADFDPAHSTIAPSYNAAWLAVTRLADRFGTAAVVRLYRDAATSPAPGSPAGDPDANTRAAFVSVLHITEAQFTRDWLAYLRRLSASGA